MGTNRSVDRRMDLERVLVWIRWGGIGFGAFQVARYTPIDPGTAVPSWLRPTGFAALAGFAAFNAAIMLFLRRRPGERALSRAGAATFAIDLMFLWGITWLFGFERLGPTWVILYLGSLEGAMRYQFRGALLPVALGVFIEPARRLFENQVFGHDLPVTNVTFRLGIWALLAAALGMVTRRLETERTQAEDLAARETTALRELNALHTILLVGVAATRVPDALQAMVGKMAQDLGYGSLTVLLLEEDGSMRPAAAHGLPAEALNRVVAPGDGVVGAVAQTGKPEIIEDTTRDPRTIMVDPITRSQVAVPVLVGTRVAGVLSAEGPRVGGFSEADRVRLERLAAYMGMVLQNARLLDQERATVERLRELDTMKSDFVAITSHELRTPLTAMRGFIKTLRRSDLTISDQELEEFLSILDRQSDRLAHLVEDLLIVSRIDAGVLQLEMQVVTVEEVLNETLQELGPRSQRVRLIIDRDLPSLVTDAQRLGQIARNLLENALKFSPSSETVRLTALREGGRLVLEVTDRGPGIPAEELSRIFDRFHQVGGPMHRQGEGFGLGLYITRRLVEALGGSMEVESDLGRGTTFRVGLPLAPAEEEEAQQEGRGTA